MSHSVKISVGDALRFSWSGGPAGFRTIESHIAVRARAHGFKMVDYADQIIAEIAEDGFGSDPYEETTKMFAALYRCLTLRSSETDLPYAAFIGECDLDFSLAVTSSGTVSIALLGQDRHALQ